MAENSRRSAAGDMPGDLEEMVGVAREAGEIAMRYFTGDNRVWTKSGNSPVSEADIEVNEFLHEKLLAARPDYGWLSEESEHSDERLGRERVFVIDPIDGTRGFIAGEKQWAVCVGVVRDGRPESGVIHCPAAGRTFSAALGKGAWLNGSPMQTPVSSGIQRVTGSKRLNTELAEHFAGRIDIVPFIPSLACRIVMVANGELDGAFARPGAHDWDLAAADLILSETGGAIVDLAGDPLRYNQAKLGFPSLLAAGPGRLGALFALAKDGGFLQ
ncbi:MAG: 3'(2'),5'-bisphosphate nucleotidase CysQ [Salaquimonas sp.]|nr:3'(2'),5'-bisphosphate nucleotidase CysQ [Salaquimonas sp.]